jgi:hypothetical protein
MVQSMLTDRFPPHTERESPCPGESCLREPEKNKIMGSVLPELTAASA